MWGHLHRRLKDKILTARKTKYFEAVRRHLKNAECINVRAMPADFTKSYLAVTSMEEM